MFPPEVSIKEALVELGSLKFIAGLKLIWLVWYFGSTGAPPPKLISLAFLPIGLWSVQVLRSVLFVVVPVPSSALSHNARSVVTPPGPHVSLAVPSVK